MSPVPPELLGTGTGRSRSLEISFSGTGLGLDTVIASDTAHPSQLWLSQAGAVQARGGSVCDGEIQAGPAVLTSSGMDMPHQADQYPRLIPMSSVL